LVAVANGALIVLTESSFIDDLSMPVSSGFEKKNFLPALCFMNLTDA
jgi:hypothetical protein